MNRLKKKMLIRRSAKARALAVHYICGGCEIRYLRKVDAVMCCGMHVIEESKQPKEKKNVSRA
jgi:hypothetical protein